MIQISDGGGRAKNGDGQENSPGKQEQINRPCQDDNQAGGESLEGRSTNPKHHGGQADRKGMIEGAK